MIILLFTYLFVDLLIIIPTPQSQCGHQYDSFKVEDEIVLSFILCLCYMVSLCNFRPSLFYSIKLAQSHLEDCLKTLAQQYSQFMWNRIGERGGDTQTRSETTLINVPMSLPCMRGFFFCGFFLLCFLCRFFVCT